MSEILLAKLNMWFSAGVNGSPSVSTSGPTFDPSLIVWIFMGWSFFLMCFLFSVITSYNEQFSSCMNILNIYTRNIHYKAKQNTEPHIFQIQCKILQMASLSTYTEGCPDPTLHLPKWCPTICSANLQHLQSLKGPNLSQGKEHWWKFGGECMKNSCWWWDSWRGTHLFV